MALTGEAFGSVSGIGLLEVWRRSGEADIRFCTGSQLEHHDRGGFLLSSAHHGNVSWSWWSCCQGGLYE